MHLFHALFRDHNLEYVVCAARHMCQEAANTVGKNTTIYRRENWFKQFPNDLKIMIMCKIEHWKIPPIPRFSKGQSVKLIQERRDEILSYHKTQTNYFGKRPGPLPMGKLIIANDPIWNKKRKTWIYSYEYNLFERVNIALTLSITNK